MRTPILTTSKVTEGTIAPYKIVAHGAGANSVVQANAATDPLLGVGPEIAKAAGETCDIHRNGVAEVEYGGTVSRGDILTSDAQGRAVATTTANNAAVGYAEVDGVVGQIGSVHISLFNV